VKLENRPLTLQLQQLENEQIPVDIPRNTTYTSADSYIHDIISFHDSRLCHKPNSINHLEDGFYQTSALMVMRSIWSCYFSRELLRGPLFLTFTDIHQSNIFVDYEWNITYFIDLEWAYSQPLEIIHPPHWSSDQATDSISSEKYGALHKEFIEEESKEITISSPKPHSVLQRS
jgi:hypothetical protein